MKMVFEEVFKKNGGGKGILAAVKTKKGRRENNYLKNEVQNRFR